MWWKFAGKQRLLGWEKEKKKKGGRGMIDKLK